jgi:hypothetical protein
MEVAADPPDARGVKATPATAGQGVGEAEFVEIAADDGDEFGADAQNNRPGALFTATCGRVRQER